VYYQGVCITAAILGLIRENRQFESASNRRNVMKAGSEFTRSLKHTFLGARIRRCENYESA
jgi:hypothetical protein